MKTLCHAWLVCALVGCAAAASAAEPPPIRYEVSFHGEVVATQTVAIAHADGTTTLATSFSAQLPVFVVLQPYSEQLSVTFRPDGTVERLGAILLDGGNSYSISGTLQDDGLLHVLRTDREGESRQTIARDDYDFNSLAFYGRAPADFLPARNPARVLQVHEGRVAPVSIQTISESDTFDRQHLVSTHLVWTAGTHVSHSWHPERFSNLPRRYVRQTANGEFTFTLIR